MHTTLSLLLALTICLPAAVRADPFDHTWCRLVTERFEIITDLSAREVNRLAEEMAVFEVVAKAFIHGNGKSADLPLKVVVFRDHDDFRTAMKATRFSGFMQPSLQRGMLIIGPQQNGRPLRETALHEYTHYLLRNLIDVSFPVWYDEGLANFLSTMTMSRRNVTIGNAPTALLRNATRTGLVNLSETVESRRVYEWEQIKLNDFYLMAWTLVHFIEFGHKASFDDRREQLEAYLSAVISPFEATFDTSYERLAGELRDYTRKRKLPSIRLPRPKLALRTSERECLDDQSRNYELASAMVQRNPEDALAVMAALNTQDPADVRYLIGLSMAHFQLRQFRESRSFAQQALTMDPGDPSAQIEFATRLVRGCMLVRAPGCVEKWARAVELFQSSIRADPHRFDAALGLGLSYLHAGNPEDALNYLRIAYQKVPWAPHINFYLGECYRLVDDDRAVVHLTNARNWSSVEIWKRLADAALAELD
jgi:tetratricopeptide (TPR) repeat protein